MAKTNTEKKKAAKKKAASTKKKVTRKTAVKKTATSKKTAPVKKAEAVKSASTSKTNVAPQQRDEMIAVAAYYRWEQSGYVVELEEQHWLLAEEEIDKLLKQ
jgi:putative AlgH/UPF0301 family transcriptional regulator